MNAFNYTFNDYNSNSYIYSSSYQAFEPSSIGNFCIRSRFDSDGTLGDIPVIDELPSVLTINKAYPNPFNPTINLSYKVNVPNNILINIVMNSPDIVAKSPDTSS